MSSEVLEMEDSIMNVVLMWLNFLSHRAVLSGGVFLLRDSQHQTVLASLDNPPDIPCSSARYLGVTRVRSHVHTVAKLCGRSSLYPSPLRVMDEGLAD